MSLHVSCTTDGPAALETLRATVHAAKGGDPLAPVTVLVPTNSAGVLARRALGRAGGIAAVQFLTLFRLAELLGGPALAAVERTPLSTPVATAAIGAVLAEAPGRFAPVHRHPTTVAAVLAASRELRQLPQSALRRLAQVGSPLASDLVRVHDAARRALAPSWHDEADLLDAAFDAATAARVAELGSIVVHLPNSLAPGAVRLLQRLAEYAPVEMILPWCHDPAADSIAVGLAAAVEAPLPAPPPAPERRPVEVVDASDADEEVRAVVRTVVGAALDGVPLERMAVLWTTPMPYQRLVGEHLEAAGLAWNGPSPIRLAERLAGRTLLGLLELDRFGLRRTDLFALLGNAPVRDRAGAPVPAAAWERVSKAAGVGRGADWAPRLQEYARLQQLEADTAEASGDESRALRSGREARHAERLQAFVAWVSSELGDRSDTRPWNEWATWSHRLLAVLLGGEQHRRRLPPVEQAAFDRVERALDRLRELDRVAVPPDRLAFHDALAAALDAELLRAGRIGNGVLAGPLSSAVGLDADLVVVLGLAEGLFPRPSGTDPLLPDTDRRAVAPLLRTAEQHQAEQRRFAVAALRAAAHTVVSVPRGDLRQSCVRGPSPWLAELLPASSRIERPVASFEAGVVGAGFPATASDHRIRGLLAHRRAGLAVADHPLARTDRALHVGLRMSLARGSSALTEFDGDLSGLAVPSPFDTDAAVAPTRLETWVACPHRYLLQHVLRIPEPDDRDTQLMISPMDRGNLLHHTIDRFLRSVLDGELPLPSPAEPWTDTHHRAALAILADECGQAERSGLTGRPLLWERERRILRGELRLWLQNDDRERALRHLVPAASERAFGLPDAPWAAAEVVLPSGRAVRFRGSIDRLDRGPDGSLLVTDHKTGSMSRFEKIKEGDEFAAGTKLQLAAYAAAVAAAMGTSPVGITAEYSFTRFARRKGYTVTGEIWDRFLAILDTIAGGIDAGLFPQHPDAPGFQLWVNCHYCDPDGLGTGASHRRWLAKRDDPRLEPYLRLIGEAPVPETAEPTAVHVGAGPARAEPPGADHGA